MVRRTAHLAACLGFLLPLIAACGGKDKDKDLRPGDEGGAAGSSATGGAPVGGTETGGSGGTGGSAGTPTGGAPTGGAPTGGAPTGGALAGGASGAGTGGVVAGGAGGVVAGGAGGVVAGGAGGVVAGGAGGAGGAPIVIPAGCDPAHHALVEAPAAGGAGGAPGAAGAGGAGGAVGAAGAVGAGGAGGPGAGCTGIIAGTLADAVACAAPYATVLVCPDSTIGGPHDISAGLSIDKPLTVRSIAGRDATTLSGGTVTVAAYARATALEGVTVTGSPGRGVVASNYSELTVAASTISGNAGGLAVGPNARLTVANSRVTGNSADTGAGIDAGRHATLAVTEGTTISDNTALGAGGGIHAYGATVILRNATVSGNTAVDGGGIATKYAYPRAGSVTLEASSVTGNTATNGGGIYAEGVPVLISRASRIRDNIATAQGGGIRHTGKYYGDVEVRDSVVSGNSAPIGGGASLEYGSLTLTRSSLSGNTATVRGGGVDINRGELTARGQAFGTPSRIENNSAPLGGGIAASVGSTSYSNVVLVDTVISGNAATDGSGGALYQQTGYALIDHCQVSANTATVDGGALFVDHQATGSTNSGPPLYIESSILTGNTATVSGGAVALRAGAWSRVTGSAIQDSEADRGGAFDLIYAEMRVTDSVVTGNTATVGGAAALAYARFIAEGSDWGSAAQANDNAPADVQVDGQSLFVADDELAFTCLSNQACTPTP